MANERKLRPDRLAEYVREARSKRGWSQDELARTAKLSSATIRRIERSIVPQSPATLRAIASALGIGVEELKRLAHGEVDTSKAVPLAATEGASPQASVDFLLFSVLEVERQALLRHFREAGASFDPSPSDGQWKIRLPIASGNMTTITLISSSQDQGRLAAALKITSVVNALQPRNLIVVGLAAGTPHRTSLGDILLANQIVDASMRKLTRAGEEQLQSQVYRTSKKITAAAQTIDGGWVNRIAVKRPDEGRPQVHLGPVACLDAIVTDFPQIASLSTSFRNLCLLRQICGSDSCLLDQVLGHRREGIAFAA